MIYNFTERLGGSAGAPLAGAPSGLGPIISALGHNIEDDTRSKLFYRVRILKNQRMPESVIHVSTYSVEVNDWVANDSRIQMAKAALLWRVIAN